MDAIEEVNVSISEVSFGFYRNTPVFRNPRNLWSIKRHVVWLFSLSVKTSVRLQTNKMTLNKNTKSLLELGDDTSIVIVLNVARVGIRLVDHPMY